MKKQERLKLKMLDLSHNPLNIEGLKTIGRFFIDFNIQNIVILKLCDISEFVYLSDEFSAVLCQILSKNDSYLC